MYDRDMGKESWNQIKSIKSNLGIQQNTVHVARPKCGDKAAKSTYFSPTFLAFPVWTILE